MNANANPHVVLANAAKGPQGVPKPLRLEYRDELTGTHFRLDLLKFILSVSYLKDRVRDLLEIAAYVFVADRSFSRGDKSAVEYHSWSRSFEFHIRVRDFEFWNNQKVKDSLSQVLTFMTGDAQYTFHFESGHITPPTSLFDNPDLGFNSINEDVNITLFSGGLDSLCGTIDLLESNSTPVCLISHQSRSGITHTQKKLRFYQKISG